MQYPAKLSRLSGSVPPLLAVALVFGASSAARADSRVVVIAADTHTGSLDASPGDTETWGSFPSGWSFARAYRSGSDDYLILVRRNTGEIEIRDVTPGSLGIATSSYNLRQRFSGVDVVELGGTPFLFLHDASTGDLRTYAPDSDGTLGTSTTSNESALEGRELFAAFSVQGQGRLFAYDRWSGDYVVH